ncbi:MAG TPA: hypoxanthine phosphoribosyltransferase [Syntrophorhabdus sp.]|nr:hypoxanthine phosphoribosyltransferase [Syntrophorhabdus sp.]MDI9556769.1 hypoxanthine phosphoribosyltransferase [Pseudomonadota bacterium]OPX92888.1 MAG: Hypoxanthine phosphoribosyltransferase [Syntrophorhabdus sp. PtaB.Bin027]OQB75247.1 MAG: Hypoxanthine phosphoribosyltransferase [Deltaproteobacteria bacterium ADurb.Bin135]MBP8744517.1 hypoxanthine phosphoribosyltransferase [Syntrophorhabdus sp.]
MLKKLFSREEIDRAVKRLATEIENDYDNEQIIFICLLKGSFMFTADLIRKIRNPLRVDFLRASSYGCGTNSKGEVTIGKDIEEGIESENVIIVEDIIDSGLTLTRVRNMLQEKNPKSLRICALLDKRARRKVDIEGDYVGFTLEDGFVVGYGIDYAEEYRNLPDIFVIVGE